MPLDLDALHRAVHLLAARDADLAGIVARHGMPPLWPREPGFAALARIVIEQQVSLASADAAYGRLASAAGGVSPDLLLRLDEAGIRAAGITRQKAR